MKDFAKLREKNAKKAYLAELAKEGERAARLKAAKLSTFGMFPGGELFAIGKRDTAPELASLPKRRRTPGGEKLCKIKLGGRKSRLCRVAWLSHEEFTTWGRLAPGMVETLTEAETKAYAEAMEMDRARKMRKEAMKAARTKSEAAA